MSLSKFYIKKGASIIDALKQINNNQTKFLVVIDDEKTVLGITTEGDIRRILINTLDIKNQIPFNTDFIKIYIDDDFSELFKYFKIDKIEYIPIVTRKNKLVNVVSKKQFNVMLLKDIEFNLKTLPQINEKELDFEIFPKPWGFYKSTLLAKHVQSKIITIFPEEELSLQKHKKREEHWIIIKGEGKIVLQDSILNVEQGRYIYIPKGCKHQIINTSKCENLILTEVQLGSYFGEDDIIRYQDKYGRV